MATTVRQLMERLGECDPGAVVLLAQQPSWPLHFEVLGVAAPDEFGPDPCGIHGDVGCEGCDPLPETPTVWIVQGEPADPPYAAYAIWSVAR